MKSNTLEDIEFAVMYLDYISRRAMDPEQRARAQILLGLIKMLDSRYPTWRSAFLRDLEENDECREISDLFRLPRSAEDSLFTEFLSTLAKPKGSD